MTSSNSFQYGDAVVVLGILMNGDRVDAPAKYKGIMQSGPKKNCAIIELNTIKLYLEPDGFMNAEEYFKLYNNDRNNLPPKAAKILWFMEYVESSGNRGSNLDKVIDKISSDGSNL